MSAVLGNEVLEPAAMASWWATRRPGIRSGLSLVASLYLGVHLCLVAWVAVPALALGWTPQVVLSDSMRPSIGAGDIVLADADPAGTVAVGSLVVVDRAADDGTNVHRVVEVRDGRYRTKGDANTAFDAGTVGRSDVRAVGRLLVPLVGTPIMWFRTGQVLPAAMWSVSMVAAIALARRRRPAR